MKFAIGGCAYRNMVHTRHVKSVVELLVLSAQHEDYPQLAAVHYLHTSNLPQGRCLWLRELINQRALEWAICVDSDTEFDAVDLIHRMPSVNGDRAIGIVPMVIGGTGGAPVLNINDGQGRIAIDDFAVSGGLVGVLPIQSGGFGLGVFNLRWFRRHWPDPAPIGITMARGEDIALCEAVVARGGSIVALKVGATHHDVVARPGQSISYVEGKLTIS